MNWRSSLKERVMPRGISNGENKDGVYLLCADKIQLQQTLTNSNSLVAATIVKFAIRASKIEKMDHSLD